MKPRIVYLGEPVATDGACLRVLELSERVGFKAARLYWLDDVDIDTRRGFHAHKRLKQAMICVRGEVSVSLRSPQEVFEFSLDSPENALMVPPGYWRELWGFSADALVVVLASDPFDETDYIRDWEDFLNWSSKS